MLFGILSGYAQSDIDNTDKNGTTWRFTLEEVNGEKKAVLTSAFDYGEEVVIPEYAIFEDKKYPVYRINDSFSSDKLKKVTLPKTVTILDHTFYGQGGLTEIINTRQIEACYNRVFNNTGIQSIDLSNCLVFKDDNGYWDSKGMFGNCTNLQEVKLAQAHINIPSSCFAGCSNLKNINLELCDTIGESAFAGCSSLTPFLNLQSIKSIGSKAFEGCTSLQEVSLPSTLESICGFNECTNLTKINLENCKTIVYNAFSNCTSLQEIDLKNCQQIQGEAFFGCSSLTKIDLPNCESLIGNYIFRNCENLQSVSLGKNITSIPSSCFLNCVNLRNINLENCTEIKGDAFNNCPSLENINLENCKTIGQAAFCGCSSLKNIDLKNVTTLGRSAFYDCTYLSNIKFSEKITNIEVDAFKDCNSLNIEINSPSVPKLGSSFPSNTIITVPSNSLDAYRTANIWKENAGQIFAIGTKLDYDVKTTAEDNAPGLLQQLDRNNLNSIVTLKVSGTINSYDIMLFRNKMDNLHHLDLSDADIVGNPYEYYQGYSTQDSILGDYAFSNLEKLISIKLPKSVKYIKRAFQDCVNLTSVELPEKLISTYDSFVRCSHLKEVKFQDCENIDYNSFYYCSSLKDIKFPQNLKNIGSGAFYNCSSLKSVILPEGLEYLNSSVFAYCANLRYIALPTSLKKIERRAFYSCALDSISLPGVTYIGNEAFQDNKSLKELRVPSTLEKIEDEAFSGCNLEKVYAYTVLPISISQNTFDNFSNISLYVPTQSVDNYYLNTQWSQFKEIHEFNEPYKYFYLDKEFTLDDKRFDGTPDIDIKQDGGLTVDGKDKQEAGDITIKGDGDNGNSGTLITDGNVNAKKMKFEIQVTANKWYFFSFPFDIKFADTKTPGEYKWKRYDGSIRADQGFGGWVDIAKDEEYLKQGVGYIFQTNQEGILTLSVTKDKFGELDANNVMKELDSYPSGNNFDASWNFIGNPQTSYFNVNDLGYQAPITVWNGNSYEAVRPGDDDYTLHPFEAFFVQKPTAVSGIEFKAEDRLTKTGSVIRAQETKARRIARGITPSRLIINLSVSDGTQTDKTRVVFNNQKSRDYEMDCDAAKFMTMTAAPQLYSIEGKGTQFAINERPMGSVQLGFSAKKAGTYTISAARMDQPMLLKDNQAGVTFDLTNGDYEFTSGAGTFNTRFMLIANGNATGIADIVSKTGVNIMPTDEGLSINGANGKTIDVYNLNGMQVATRNSDGMLNLPTGVYIVKVEGLSSKVMVK